MILLFRRLRTVDLIELCRSMRFALASGLMLRDVMELLANQATPRVRNAAAGIARELKAGWSLPEALEKQKGLLPPLFVSLAIVGEESGNLPEVLGEVEKYYTLRLKLRREFTEQILGPVLQLVAAIVIVSLLLYVMGVLPRADLRAPPLDPLGLGLVGPGGALIFFSVSVGSLVGLVGLFLLLRRLLRRRALVEWALLYVPAVGPCFRAMALARFSVAGRLMLETSLSILKTGRLAFQATDNAAFIAAFPAVEKSLRQGNSITDSLARTRLFPQRFLSAVGVGEVSGRLPETLRHQAEEYDDESRRRLGWLTRAMSWLVWLGVAALIISCIFRIFNEAYLKNMNRFLEPGRSTPELRVPGGVQNGP
jgi:type II secretory pathway component PulF